MSEELKLTEQDQVILSELALKANVDSRELMHLLIRDFQQILAGTPDALNLLRSRRLYQRLLEQEDMALPIRSTPDVMGGDVCIRNTRIPVWTLAFFKREGMTDTNILANYPGLNAADLTVAWDYYAAHADEVEAERHGHEDAQ